MKIGVFGGWASPFVYTKWADSAMNLERPKDTEVRFFRGTGWCSARQHIDGCERAIQWGADALLTLGFDQTYDPDFIPRMYARYQELNMHLDGRGVVSALVPSRGYFEKVMPPMRPFQPMSWRVDGDLKDFAGMDKEPEKMHHIDPADGDWQRTSFAGTGAVMFSRQILLNLPQPWFREQVHVPTWQIVGTMDTEFLFRLHTMCGAEMWVDTTIKIGHLHVFDMDDTFQYRFDDWMEPGKGDPEICRYK